MGSEMCIRDRSPIWSCRRTEEPKKRNCTGSPTTRPNSWFGSSISLPSSMPNQEFGLVVGEPVQFRFFGSSVRRQDQIGDVLDFWGPEELIELNEIQATLSPEGRQPGDVVQVRLHAMATESGTLELLAVANDGQRWKVEFDVRSGATESAAA